MTYAEAYKNIKAFDKGDESLKPQAIQKALAALRLTLRKKYKCPQCYQYFAATDPRGFYYVFCPYCGLKTEKQPQEYKSKYEDVFKTMRKLAQEDIEWWAQEIAREIGTIDEIELQNIENWARTIANDNDVIQWLKETGKI